MMLDKHNVLKVETSKMAAIKWEILRDKIPDNLNISVHSDDLLNLLSCRIEKEHFL